MSNDDRRARVRVERILIAVAAVCGALALALALQGPPTITSPLHHLAGPDPMATFEPGFTFSNTLGFANVSFSSNISATSRVGMDAATGAVIIDGLTFAVTRDPAAPPYVNVSVGLFDVSAGDGGTALVFNATASAPSAVSFVLTGLRGDMNYRLYVDGVAQSVLDNSGGAITFAWFDWSQHEFALQAVERPNPAAYLLWLVILLGLLLVVLFLSATIIYLRRDLADATQEGR